MSRIIHQDQFHETFMFCKVHIEMVNQMKTQLKCNGKFLFSLVAHHILSYLANPLRYGKLLMIFFCLT